MSDSHAWVIKNTTTGKYYDTQRLRWSDEIGIPHAEPPYSAVESLIVDCIFTQNSDTINIILVEWDDESDYWVEKRKRTYSMPLLQHVSAEFRSTIRRLAEPYAPDWSQAPDWAKWYTMFDNGEVIFWELEPKCIFLSYEWVWKEKDEKIGLTISRMSSKVPIAIDWRLCKWQRPEVAP